MKPFSIHPCIRTDKPLVNGNYPIYFRIMVMGEETKIPMGYDIEKNLWDSRSQLPKKNPFRLVIQNLKSDLENYLLTEQATGAEISVKKVKDYYDKSKQLKPEKCSFYDYYLEFVERKRKEGKDDDTIRIYNGTYRMLKEFSPNLKISEIDLKFIENFDAFLRDVKKNQDGSRENKHKNLRAVILDMIRHDLDIKNPYLIFKIPKSKIREVYLEFDELIKLRKLLTNYKFSTPKRNSLQMFLLACYTGLRISDILDLKWSNIDWEKQRIYKTQIKSKNTVTSIIEPWAKILLLEYSNGKKNIGTDKLVFEKQQTSQNIGRHIKGFIKIAEINKDVSFHSSRHTFGTFKILAESDIFTVSKLLGHSNLKTTMVYFNDSQKLIDNHAKKNKLFSNENLK